VNMTILDVSKPPISIINCIISITLFFGLGRCSDNIICLAIVATMIPITRPLTCALVLVEIIDPSGEETDGSFLVRISFIMLYTGYDNVAMAPPVIIAACAAVFIGTEYAINGSDIHAPCSV
jgi:hypothetical protein